MSSKMWDEIIYSFPNFNGSTVEVDWIIHFIPHFIMDVVIFSVLKLPVTHWNHIVAILSSQEYLQYLQLIRR